MNTNNRDLRTGLLFKIEDKKEQTYLFSCPDGFQRVANFQKLKFGKVKVFFVPSLDPDHFAGFPGFFLSSREKPFNLFLLHVVLLSTGRKERSTLETVGCK